MVAASFSPTPSRVLARHFELQRLLGKGGCGEVYAALDRRDQQPVALKILPAVEPETLYRFKQEFRQLAGVRHRNLVRLREMFASKEGWFFTMELVHGCDFLQFVRSSSEADLSAPTWLAETLPEGLHAPEVIPEARIGGLGVNLERLRLAMCQLVEGVAALHEAGKMHRDLKPSNVMVTPEQRVVVLDFGLVVDLGNLEQGLTQIGHLAGTPAYMAPEQILGECVGPAADWYAVGVLLFEALTGHLPFEGHVFSILQGKQTREAPRASARRDVPEALDQLCSLLLAKDPSARPGAQQILDALEGRQRLAPRAVRPSEEPFVGRQEALATLKDALAQSIAGQPTVVCVEGGSGMGKSALIRKFLEESAGAMVLSGRCYEHESVPYKAIDPIIDAAARALKRRPPEELAGLLPPGLSSLMALFPVLRPVAKRARIELAEPPLAPAALREQAIQAMRALLRALAQQGPLVLIIDDLQWGDAESAVLLHALITEQMPPLLLVLAYRDSEVARGAALRMLRGAGPLQLPPPCATICLNPLSQQDALELAGQLRRGSDPEYLLRLSSEAKGCPFILVELCYQASLSPTGAVGVDALLDAQLAELPPEAKLLLRCAALASEPTEPEILYKSARLSKQRGDELQRELCLVRLLQLRGRGRLEIRHDRIREHLERALPSDEACLLHERLASALEASPHPDPERLLRHWRLANQWEQAAASAQQAARRAASAFAFDRAARLYQETIDLLPQGALAPWEELADALAKAGRGKEASEAYLRAAAQDPARARSLGQRATAMLLRAGYLEDGLRRLRGDLESAGMTPPSGLVQALVLLLWTRLWLAFRWRSLRAVVASPEALERLDLCWAAALGLAGDPGAGGYFEVLHLRLALQTTDPARRCRALAMEAFHLATMGLFPGRVRSLLHQARALAKAHPSPYSLGFTRGMSGMVKYLQGDWSKGFLLLDTAEKMLREHCEDVAWELDIVRVFSLECVAYQGDLQTLCHRVPEAIREAEGRGDRLAATMLRTGIQNMAWLALDDPEEARRQLQEAEAQWPRQGFLVQHFLHLFARVQIALYEGDGAAAMAHLQQAWPAMRRSLLLSVPFVQICARHLRGRAALASLVSAPQADHRRLLSLAGRDARWLIARRFPWCEALGRSLLAAAAVRRGAPDAASLLRDAASLFRCCGMLLHAEVCELRSAESEGMAREPSLQAIRARGSHDPERMAATLLPG